MNVTRASRTGQPVGPKSLLLSIGIVPFAFICFVLALVTMDGWPVFLFLAYIVYTLYVGVKND